MAGDGGLADDAPPPDRLEQVVLADDACPVFDQIGQKIEDLRADRNRTGSPLELPPVKIECAVPKQQHGPFLARTVRRFWTNLQEHLDAVSRTSVRALGTNLVEQ